MTKIHIEIVTARKSLAPGHVPFYTVTCKGCGHDDHVNAVTSTWPPLHKLFEDAIIRAESMYFDHLTGTGHTKVRICPISLFDSEDWNRRIGYAMGDFLGDAEDEEES